MTTQPIPERIRVLVYIPLHCTSLASLFHHFCKPESSFESSEQSFDENKIPTLVLSCHGEGGMIWRGIVPILLHAKKAQSSLFINNLFKHFHTDMHCPFNPLPSKSEFFLFSSYIEPMNMKSLVGPSSLQQNFQLIILPPFPTPYTYPNTSSIKSQAYLHLYPERIYTPYLIQSQNRILKLQTLNAYLSTMGGGYFLCRCLTISIQIARQQQRVALALGDLPLALKCIVNEAYNWIHVGKVKKARNILKWVEKFAHNEINSAPNLEKTKKSFMKQEENKEFYIIRNMCKSAKLFAIRVQREQKMVKDIVPTDKKTRNTNHHTENISLLSARHNDDSIKNERYTATHDDYQRIRIVTMTSLALESMG